MVNNNNSNLSNKNEAGEKSLPKNNITSGKEEMDFKELYEQSLNQFQYGDIATGKVVQIKDDRIMVDVGWKTEGFIPIDEVRDAQGNVTISIDDEIDVFIDRRDSEGNLVLSRDKASKVKIWDEIKNACENDTVVEGVVVEKVKGGLSVDIGIIAFLPGSQVDIRPVKDLDKFVGQTLDFKVLKFDRKRNNVVLSRRSIVASEREAEKQDILKNIQEGNVVEGIIKNITDYGVFIDLGGVDGLLHVTDISWGELSSRRKCFRKAIKLRPKFFPLMRRRKGYLWA